MVYILDNFKGSIPFKVLLTLYQILPPDIFKEEILRAVRIRTFYTRHREFCAFEFTFF